MPAHWNSSIVLHVFISQQYPTRFKWRLSRAQWEYGHGVRTVLLADGVADVGFWGDTPLERATGAVSVAVDALLATTADGREGSGQEPHDRGQ